MEFGEWQKLSNFYQFFLFIYHVFSYTFQRSLLIVERSHMAKNTESESNESAENEFESFLIGTCGLHFITFLTLYFILFFCFPELISCSAAAIKAEAGLVCKKLFNYHHIY